MREMSGLLLLLETNLFPVQFAFVNLANLNLFIINRKVHFCNKIRTFLIMFYLEILQLGNNVCYFNSDDE